jgi:uncharacterized coiled-coil protein SlyX
MKSPLLLVTIALPVAIACAGSSPSLDPAPDTVSPPVRVVTETVTVRDRESEQRAAELQVQLMDKDAQIDELQARLDEAQRDVVRSLAKVQTLATRAEAASAMAEAEVALETLRRAVGAQGPGVARTRALLDEATEEFNKQNYGGSLWLSNQAKNRAAVSRGRLTASDSLGLLDGEKSFSIPIRFETTGRTNLRMGPGTTYETLATLDGGTALTGYSYLQQWIRVTDNSGRAGWVFYSLVRRKGTPAN